MVTLSDLWARTELSLDVVVDSGNAGQQEVTIVHSSELPEVDEWLAGGEVLLTIGVGQDLGADAAGDYLARLKDAGVHALGIGLGADLPWQEIPSSLIGCAKEVGLPLFGVPEPVPFVAVVDAFTRMREDETNRELKSASNAGRRFATALAHRGPAALVRELAEALGAPVRFVSPTGRSLTGVDAGAEVGVRCELIAESIKPSLVPRLIRSEASGQAEKLIEAVPVGDAQVRGWMLVPMEADSAVRTRALLLSTAAALLGMSVAEDLPRREESPLFSSTMSAVDARAEWVMRTGHAPLGRARIRIFGGVRGEAAEMMMSDLSSSVLVARAGVVLAVIDSGDCDHDRLITRAAEVMSLEEILAKEVPLTEIHHIWTVWRSQHESSHSDVSALLSSIDERAARRFVEQVLGRLLAAKAGDELLTTLRAYISAGGVRDRVAAELGIHRHTVRARIAKIEELIGRDLSRAEETAAVAMAIELAEM